VKLKNIRRFIGLGRHFHPMRARHWGAESFLPWVNAVAEHIGDPVARLRFLRVAVPCAQPRPGRFSRLRRFFAAVYVKWR
jgi:hypothetical protein